jgi:hypothetical protein
MEIFNTKILTVRYSTACVAGLPDFFDTIYQNGGKYTTLSLIYKMAQKYTGMSVIYSKGHRICQPFPFQGHPKFIHIGIFGLKIYHLANPVV